MILIVYYCYYYYHIIIILLLLLSLYCVVLCLSLSLSPAQRTLGPRPWLRAVLYHLILHHSMLYAITCLFYIIACYIMQYLGSPEATRPISLLRLSLLRFVDSNFPVNSLWT